MEIKRKIKNKLLVKLEQYINLIAKRKEVAEKQNLTKKINKIGANSFLWGKNHKITGPENLSIGENVHINDNCYIRAEGGVEIGDNTHISRNLLLYSINHDYEGTALPYDSNMIKKKVVIGKNVWIGMNVCITPGTHIGDGVIVGMGTVVSGKVPSHSIIGGAKWRVIGERNLDAYQYLEKNKKYGGINGTLYTTENNNLSENNPKVISKRGIIEFIEHNGVKKVKKQFDPVKSGQLSLENEKIAIENFNHYGWFPKSELIGDTIITDYFDSESRVDKILKKLSKEELESLKSQIIFALIDIYKCGFSHRDIHTKNLFFIDGQLKIIDFETLIKRTNDVSFFESYDIVGKNEESPFATNFICLLSNNKFSLNQIFQFNSIDDFKKYLQIILNEKMINVSNSFFTRKKDKDGRHILKRKLIYNTFDLKEIKVNAEQGQRNIEKRIKRFNILKKDIEGKKILDLGSNIGGILLGLHKYNYQDALGFEYDIEKVELSRTIAAINNIKNVSFKPCDLESKNFLNDFSESYDIVFSLAVIEHLKNKNDFLIKLFNLTKEKLFMEGNANTDVDELIYSLTRVGFSKVDFIGLSDDELFPDNNKRPLFIAYK